MGQRQSKEELVYQLVIHNNVEGIKAFCRDGAGLEWRDCKGKTSLIVACENPELHNVAKILIEFGANVNAYSPGPHAGTPLHHAAKRGLENTVKLLLSCGANEFMMNDDGQTPLDVARAKGFTNVVRAIESHICLFSGWLWEHYGPEFLEKFVPQLFCRKVWVVVLPCGSLNLTTPLKLELAIYSTAQHPQPRKIMALGKGNMDDPKFHQHDHTVMITHNATKTRIKLVSATENDKQQLEWFCNACKGIVQVSEHACGYSSIPSAPFIDNEVVDDGPISYPSIDSSPIDLSSTNVGSLSNEKKENGDTSSCVICLDAPVEGACIPCGHMAGCMSCLTEIKGKKGGCPVCRAKIDQVVRLYAV